MAMSLHQVPTESSRRSDLHRVLDDDGAIVAALVLEHGEDGVRVRGVARRERPADLERGAELPCGAREVTAAAHDPRRGDGPDRAPDGALEGLIVALAGEGFGLVEGTPSGQRVGEEGIGGLPDQVEARGRARPRARRAGVPRPPPCRRA